MSKVITDKLVDDILEVVLEDMDCQHEVDHDEDGAHASVEYNLKYELKVRNKIIVLLKPYQQIKEMIQKPGVTEERIEEKAKEIVEEIGYRIEGEYLKVHLDRAKDFIHSLLEGMPVINKDWLPTAENINVLPEPVRNYIAAMQTNADPPSMVADNIILRDTIKALEIKLEEKIQVHDELLIKYTEKFREDYERGFCSRNNYKGRLKQFAQEAGLEIVKK